MTKWTPQQLAIFDWFTAGQGNLVVRARAGCGKTSTAVESVRRLPSSRPALFAAFNKHSAEDLQNKIGGSGVHTAKTLHSLGLQIVKENLGSHIKVNGQRTKDLVRLCGAGGKLLWKLTQLASRIKDAAPWIDTPEEVIRVGADLKVLIEDHEMAFKEQADIVLKVMAASLRVEREIDFSDMVFVPYRKGWAPLNRFHTVIVDEAQDMVPAQLELAVRSVAPNGRMIVIGDDRQALYAWRGAAHDALDAMKTRLNASELPLTVSFRCSKQVTAAAREIVPDIQVPATSADGLVDAMEEAEMINAATEILSNRQNQLSMFCLSRLNAPLFPIALKFLKERVPFKIQGNDYADKIIDVVEKLKPTSKTDLVLKLELWAKQRLRSIPADSDDPEDLRAKADVRDIVTSIEIVANQQPDVRQIPTVIRQLFEGSGSGGIVLSTIHRIKGYEADIVFVLRDTLVTHNPRLQHKMPLDLTEFNIEYVAITRAKLELWWVSSAEDEK